MAEMVPNRFNLVDEQWIPVANQGLVSLSDIFFKKEFTALGGTPTQKISLIKLLLAIAQSAYTPKDDDDWKTMRVEGMADKAMAYLQEKKDCFWLYGERPFLQMPAVAKAKKQTFGVVSAIVATGNTTVFFQSQVEKKISDAEKALLLIEIGNFSFGGKQTDNSVVLSPGYMGKSKPAGKPGPALGFKGFLHNFLIGTYLLETIWINMFTEKEIISMPHFIAGIGFAPWEEMPIGEDCDRARELKTTYLGRLVPLSRFTLLDEDGLHYSEGIFYPGYSEGAFDISTGIDFSATKARALWVNTEKRPWRQLTSLLSFFSNEKKNFFDCYQLRFCLPRAQTSLCAIGIWAGGIQVENTMGEYKVSSKGDSLESEFLLHSAWLGYDWFLRLKAEMNFIEDLADSILKKSVYLCHKREMKASIERDKRADGLAQEAIQLFWQLAEHHFQKLINACGDKTAETMRPIFAKIALKAYDTYCPQDTARQLDAWAANRPQLGKYFKTIVAPEQSTHFNKGV